MHTHTHTHTLSLSLSHSLTQSLSLAASLAVQERKLVAELGEARATGDETQQLQQQRDAALAGLQEAKEKIVALETAREQHAAAVEAAKLEAAATAENMAALKTVCGGRRGRRRQKRKNGWRSLVIYIFFS